MAENNKKKNIGTIYQEMNKLLNLDGFGFDNTTPITPQKQGKIIIKGQTPEEVYQKGLELEQKKKLQEKFFKTSDRSFQKALQYEAGRLQAYLDYESMEHYPLIASALDLFMEEATTIGTNGKMLNIYSNKERIKYLLEEFFYDVVNVNVNLPFWTRNLIKYGDDFTLLYGERKKGIIHVKQMVNYEIERIEKFIDGKPIIKFKERMTGDEFNPFEIAHFRLLGDDKFIPYGSSLLNRIRRVFRQLCLDKNTNIWTPNGSIKIKNLQVGDEVYSYNYKFDTTIISKIKNVIKTGNKERFKVKTKYNEIILTDDHPLLTIDSNNICSYKNIKEITNEKIISYLILDPNNKHNHYIRSEIISIENVGVGEVWDIEVDNDLHNFIANGLVVHNCMAEDAMLTYRLVRAGEKKVFKIDVGNIDEDDIEEYMYRVATKFKKISQINPNDGQFDYRYNIVGNDEDYFIPVRNANTQTGIDTLPGACLSLDTKIELLDGRSLMLSDVINEYDEGKELWSYSINPETGIIVKSPITWAGKTRLNTDVVKLILSNGETIICTPDHKFNVIKDRDTKEAKDLLGEELWSFNTNERIFVESVIKIREKQDTGTITIDGNEIYHNFHNFALTCGIFTKNSNLSDIGDIEYLRENMLSGLGIPKPFVSFQDAAGGGKNLAQFDIRFSKKVNRIQQALIQELNKMAMIHLFLLGYSGDDLSNFTLTLTNPSTQQDLLKAELMREKAQTYNELTRGEGGILPMSHTNAKRLIFNMSDREIVEDLKQQKMERAIMQELQDAPVIIKKTGIFNDIDAKYGEPIEGLPISSGSTEQTGFPPTGGGAPIGGNEMMGGEIPPVGGETPEMGGEVSPTPPAGGGVASEMPLAENKKSVISDNLNDMINELVYGTTQDSIKKKEIEFKKIINENNEFNLDLNNNALNMINEIDELLNNTKSFSNKEDDEDTIDIDDIDIDENSNKE